MDKKQTNLKTWKLEQATIIMFTIFMWEIAICLLNMPELPKGKKNKLKNRNKKPLEPAVELRWGLKPGPHYRRKHKHKHKHKKLMR